MGFPFSPRGAGFGWVLLTALTGCGSDASGTGGTNAGVGTACAVGEFVLGGTLGGESVSHRGTVEGSSWINAGSSNKLDATFAPSGSLHATWANIILEGHTTTITGSITMPSGIPRGGETLNSSAGSLTKLDDEVRFEYGELSTSVACIQAPCAGDPVEGSLQGCLHWKPIGQ